MADQILNTYRDITSVNELIGALKELTADAGDDRIAEGGDHRVDASEVYCAPLVLTLTRQRLTDGTYAYDFRIATARDRSQAA